MSQHLCSLLSQHPIIPVVTLKRAEDGVPLAEALLQGGVGIIEITVRTEAGVPAIQEVSKRVPGMTVGAGTITSVDQFRAAEDAGAKFIVSPGLTDELAEGVRDTETSFLPGVCNASQIMYAREYGFSCLKFFPAAISGGVAALRQFSPLFPDVHFCPTGGVNLDNVNDYLSLPSVMCVGGSWIAPDALVNTQNWSEITRLSQEAMDQVARVRRA